MPHAVELLLNNEAESAIQAVFERLNECGISSAMLDLEAKPHVSLAVYGALEVGAFLPAAEAFFSRVEPVDVRFSSVGSFPGEEGVVFLAPVMTRELLTLHEAFHEQMAAYGAGCRENYRVGLWVPHCTVGFNVPHRKLGEALALVRAEAIPLTGRIERAGLLEFERGSPKPVQVVRSFPLGG